MPNGLVFEWHLKTGEPNHLNTLQMDAILFSYVLVWYLNGWSSLITELLATKNLNTKFFVCLAFRYCMSHATEIFWLQYSDHSMLVAQIPNLLGILNGWGSFGCRMPQIWNSIQKPLKMIIVFVFPDALERCAMVWKRRNCAIRAIFVSAIHFPFVGKIFFKYAQMFFMIVLIFP